MKLISTLVAGLAMTMPAAAFASDAYPARPITIVVPTAPGGGNDAMARILAQKIGAELNTSVIVENKAGANGVIASSYVARAKPDGYTVLFGYIGTHAITPAIQSVPYDPIKDFDPIGQVAFSPVIMVANPSLPVKSVQELIAYAKKPGVHIDCASAGTGTAPDMAARLFSEVTGVKMTDVPYKGAGPAMVATISGTTQIMFPSLFTGAPQVQSHTVNALAMGGSKRSALFPNLPTLKESGVDVDVSEWYGLFLPAHTPDAIVTTLNKALNEALNDADVSKKIAQQGAEVAPGTPAQFGDLVARELRRWKAVAKAEHLAVASTAQ